MDKYDSLKLENQLCFPLYACAREIVNRYRPILDGLGLTYTQYVVMLVLWEVRRIGAKELGDRLHLDSGTLTPVLKSLEGKGLVSRARSDADERRLDIFLTDGGLALRDDAVKVPALVSKCMNITSAEAQTLHNLLYKLLDCKN